MQELIKYKYLFVLLSIISLAISLAPQLIVNTLHHISLNHGVNDAFEHALYHKEGTPHDHSYDLKDKNNDQNNYPPVTSEIKIKIKRILDAEVLSFDSRSPADLKHIYSYLDNYKSRVMEVHSPPPQF